MSQRISLARKLTSCLSVIQHAWHFYYAVVSVLKCHADAWSLRASHLSKALVCKRKNAAISQDLVVKAQSLSCRIGFQF